MKKRWMTAASTFAAATMVFGAAALAQTPSPGTTTTPSATGTARATGTVVTGTMTVGGTATAQSTTVAIPTISIPSGIYVAGGGPFAFANPAFERVWTRTDRLVRDGRVSRTFFWGPGPNTPGLLEQYNEAPSGNRMRLVQYFDKSRMELNNPQGNQDNPFFVTNGLLTTELISGRIQVGDNTFVNFHSACIPMSGDFGDTLAPTYQSFARVSSVESGNNPATDRRGQRVTQTIDRNGVTGVDATKAMTGTELVQFVTETRHNIPAVFWNFLNSSGPVVGANGQTSTEQLIVPWFFASGYPISEPYWAKATIRGQVRDVMIQAFQRRALTYVPTNEAGFQVEMANIGQHYFDWRYRNAGFCPGQPVTTPTAPAPAATGTVVPGTPGTPQATGTTVTGTGTPNATGTVVPTSAVTTTPNATLTANPTSAITTTPNPTFTPGPSGSPTGVPQPILVTPTP